MTSTWVCRRAMVSVCAAANTRAVACYAALVLNNWVWLFWSDRCRGRHDRVEACACEAAPGLGVIGALVP